MSRAVVLSAVRTPIGRYGGALAGVRPDDLAALVIGEAVTRAGVRAEEIDLYAVTKASQTISGEIVLDTLIRTLLEVVLKQGGAQRA